MDSNPISSTRMSRFVRNVSSNYAVAGVHALLFIVVTPIVVQRLGLEHYAVWVIVQTIGYFLSFLDFGLSDAQVRQHARLAARGEHASIARLHGTVLTLFAGAGAAAVLLALLIGGLPSASLLDIPDTALEVYLPVLVLIGLGVAASFLDVGFDGIFEGNQRFDIKNGIDVAASVIDAVLVVTFLYLGHGLVALAAIKLASTCAAVVVKAAAARRVFPQAQFPVPGFDADAWRSVRGYTLWNSLNELTTEGTAHLDKLIIPILLASALVTPYSLVLALAAVIFVLAEPITDTFLPISSHRHSSNDSKGIATLLTRGTRLVVSATLPATVIVIFFGDAILDLWIGAEYTDVHPSVIWFTAANFFFSTFLWTPLLVLMGAGLIRRIFFVSVFEVLLALALILVLVPGLGLGLVGLALAGLIANVLTGIVFFVPAACRLANLNAPALVLRTLLQPAAVCIPAYATAYVLTRRLALDGWLELIAAVALTGLIALGAILLLSATRWERMRYLATVRRAVGS